MDANINQTASEFIIEASPEEMRGILPISEYDELRVQLLDTDKPFPPIFKIDLREKVDDLWLFKVIEDGKIIDGLQYSPDRTFLIPHGPLGRAILGRCRQ